MEKISGDRISASTIKNIMCLITVNVSSFMPKSGQWLKVDSTEKLGSFEFVEIMTSQGRRLLVANQPSLGT